MLSIELTNSTVFGEKGPNLVVRGTSEGIKVLTQRIENLVDENEITICSSELVKLTGLHSFKIKSSMDGKVLSRICRAKNSISVETDLPENLYKEILEKLNSLKSDNSYQYIEFDNVIGLEEDANIIVKLVREIEL